MTIADTAKNIERVQAFLRNLEFNYKMRVKVLGESQNISDLQNSLSFLEDYEKVVKQLLEVTKEYQMKNMGEIIF